MKPDQAIHQANLSRWAMLIKEQASSGLKVKDWCEQNGYSYHAYNYWKHIIKQTCMDNVIPDIVPVTPPTISNIPDIVPITPPPVAVVPVSRDSRNSRNLCETPDAFVLTLSDGIRIDIPTDISDERLFNLIKAVRYA